MMITKKDIKTIYKHEYSINYHYMEYTLKRIVRQYKLYNELVDVLKRLRYDGVITQQQFKSCKGNIKSENYITYIRFLRKVAGLEYIINIEKSIEQYIKNNHFILIDGNICVVKEYE